MLSVQISVLLTNTVKVWDLGNWNLIYIYLPSAVFILVSVFV